MQPLVDMYQAKKLDRWEVLFSRYGAFASFMRETANPISILSKENLKKLYYSWGNTVPIVVLNGDPLTIGDSYTCSIDDVASVSAKVTPTFTPYAWGFTMYPAEYTVGGQPLNYVQYDADFMSKADRFLLALMDSVDTSSRNILETNKNTYWTGNIANYYSVVGDSLIIPQAAKNDAFNQLAAICMEMDLYEQALVIGSTSLKPLTTRLEAQGTGNAINEAFQFQLGNFTFTGSNRVTNAVGVQSTMYMVQPGAIAIFNRNAPDFIANNKIGGGDAPVVEWSTMMLPRLEMVVGTYYKNECAESPSATSYLNNTLQATLKQSFGWNTEIGWLTPYNSDPTTKVTPIVKAQIMTT